VPLHTSDQIGVIRLARLLEKRRIATISRIPCRGRNMTSRAAVAKRDHGTHLERWGRFVVGPAMPARIPERVERAIEQEQESSEILVSLLQLVAIAIFGIVYTISPKAFPPSVPFEPVPWTLGAYAGFTLLRLWLAWRLLLTRWFLALSVIVDITVLMVTIWSFHLQYQQPAPIYLKATTLMYLFILIALRTLRFEPGLVVLAGATGAIGWLVLVAYAVLANGGATITHSFTTYAMSYQVLLGAEVDKVLSILIVTAILALALVRARKLLLRATTEQMAASELSRFFAPEVAGRIRGMEAAIEPGQAEARDAAILMIDLRGFTPLAHQLAPRAVMQLLSDYQSRMVAEIDRHGGSVDKFLGDGILASFGATRASASYAADGMRALEATIAAGRRWAAERDAAGLSAPATGAALVTGPVMFGAIGDQSRLEYTVIGDPVNLVAKLEKHTKIEGVPALCTAETYRLAQRQGYVPGAAPVEQRHGRTVAGVDGPLDLVAFG
jgi:adenylate cyclase